MTTAERLRGAIGMAARCRQIVLGEGMAVQAIRAGRASLALIDEDASENAVKKMTDACKSRSIPLARLPSGLLDQACGKEGRMAAAMSGAFAAQALKLLCDSGEHASQTINGMLDTTQNAGVQASNDQG